MVKAERKEDSAGDTRQQILKKNMTANEQTKEKYEAPDTKHVQVEMEDGICAASVMPKEDDDIAKDRHVVINEQISGGSFDFSREEWQ